MSTLRGWLCSSSSAYLALKRKKSMSSAAASISAWITVLPCRERLQAMKGRGNAAMLSGGAPPKLNPQRWGLLHSPGAARGEDHPVTPHRAPPAIPTTKTHLGSLPALLPQLLQLNPASPAPYLPNHGLGQHFSSPRAAQHVSCLQEDLRPVLHGFQVPFLPRCHGSINGFVNELLWRQRGKGSKEEEALQVPLHHQVAGKSEGSPTPDTNHWCHHSPESAAVGVDFFQDPWGLERLLEPPCSQNAFHLLNPGQGLLLPPKTARKRGHREVHSPCWRSSTWPPCVHG